MRHYFFLRAPSGVDPPDPISNSEVKHASADDTWRVASWESRSVRGIYFKRVKGIILQLWMIPLMYAGVAQLVEHYLAKVDVASSNLVSRSNTNSYRAITNDPVTVRGLAFGCTDLIRR